jgi:hypothetical protein
MGVNNHGFFSLDDKSKSSSGCPLDKFCFGDGKFLDQSVELPPVDPQGSRCLRLIARFAAQDLDDFAPLNYGQVVR